MRSENVMGQENILMCYSVEIIPFFAIAVTTTDLLKVMAFSMTYGKKLF